MKAENEVKNKMFRSLTAHQEEYIPMAGCLVFLSRRYRDESRGWMSSEEWVKLIMGPFGDWLLSSNEGRFICNAPETRIGREKHGQSD